MSLFSVLPSTDNIICFKRVDNSGFTNLLIFCNPFISDLTFLSSLPDNSLNSITISYQDFYNSCSTKSKYKYRNFKTVYNNWSKKATDNIKPDNFKVKKFEGKSGEVEF